MWLGNLIFAVYCSINGKLFYLRSINPTIEKINPITPIPIVSSSIPDELREIIIAKSNIAMPNPIFFIINLIPLSKSNLPFCFCKISITKTFKQIYMNPACRRHYFLWQTAVPLPAALTIFNWLLVLLHQMLAHGLISLLIASISMLMGVTSTSMLFFITSPFGVNAVTTTSWTPTSLK